MTPDEIIEGGIYESRDSGVRRKVTRILKIGKDDSPASVEYFVLSHFDSRHASTVGHMGINQFARWASFRVGVSADV